MRGKNVIQAEQTQRPAHLKTLDCAILGAFTQKMHVVKYGHLYTFPTTDFSNVLQKFGTNASTIKTLV